MVGELLAGRDVLEVACGTGYWTTVIARAARSVLATDIDEAPLAVARAKDYPPGVVRFALADALALGNLAGPFNAVFAGFWWSHVPVGGLRAFLATLHAVVSVGALVVFIDNRYVPGSSTPIARRDAAGNTYQQRRLPGGEAFDLLKNFPSEADLRATVAGLAEAVDYRPLTYYWRLSYRVAPGTE
jgi:demethylmenaquinone methyltransferase/2-methoxy-6-polyprenyl-1,4-benzoquinol methylase